MRASSFHQERGRILIAPESDPYVLTDMILISIKAGGSEHLLTSLRHYFSNHTASPIGRSRPRKATL